MFDRDVKSLDEKQRLAYRIEIQEYLRDNQAVIEFSKSDGSVRTMLSSLRQQDIPVATPRKTHRVVQENTNTLCVIDVEKAQWRSFRMDRLISIRAQ